LERLGIQELRQYDRNFRLGICFWFFGKDLTSTLPLISECLGQRQTQKDSTVAQAIIFILEHLRNHAPERTFTLPQASADANTSATNRRTSSTHWRSTLHTLSLLDVLRPNSILPQPRCRGVKRECRSSYNGSMASCPSGLGYP